VIFFDGITHEGNAGAILVSVPPCTVCSQPLGEGLLNLGVGEGFRFAIVPSETAEGCEIVREILLKVDAEAVFSGDMPGMGGDVWSGVLFRGMDDLIAVDAPCWRSWCRRADGQRPLCGESRRDVVHIRSFPREPAR
jgi:hypothetical protein